MDFFRNIGSAISRFFGGGDDDEEERRRREQQRQRQQRRPQRQAPRQPQPQRQPQQNAPPQLIDVLEKANPAAFRQVSPEQQQRNQDRQQLEKLTQQNLSRAVEQEKQNTSWLSRTFTDRDWRERAEAAARRRATQQFQDERGYKNNPEVIDFSRDTSERLEKATKDGGASNIVAPALSVGRVGAGIAQGAGGLFDLITPGEGQNRLTKAATRKAEEIDELAQDLGVEDTYRAGNVPLEIASYFIPGTAATRLTKATSALRRPGQAAQRAITGSGESAGRRFAGRAARESLSPENLATETAITSKYQGERSARGEEFSPTSLAVDAAAAVGGGAVPAAFRTLREAYQLRKAPNVHGEPTNIPTGSSPDEGLQKAPQELDTGIISTKPQARAGAEATARMQADEAAGAVPTARQADHQVAEQAAAGPQLSDNLGRSGEATEDIIAQAQRQFDEYVQSTPGLSKEQIDAARASLNQQLARRIEEIQAPNPSEVTTPPEPTPEARPVIPSQESTPVAAQTAEEIDTSVPAAETPPEGAQVTGPVQPASQPAPIPESQAVQGSADATAPRTREQLLNRVEDEQVRSFLASGATRKERTSLKNAENTGTDRVRNLSDEDLVQSFSRAPSMTDPADFFEGLTAMRRLERIDTPEARAAATNIMEGVANKSSESGLWQRASQVIFAEAPPTMQASMLMKKLNRLNAKFEGGEAEAQEAMFKRLAAADEVNQQITGLQDRAIKIQDDLKAGAISRADAEDQAADVASRYNTLIDDMRVRNGEVLKLFEQYLPKGEKGARVGAAARLAMLSSPFGRAFDVISTTATTLADTAARTGSALFGKGVNWAVGDAAVKSDLPSLRKVFSQYTAGLKRTGQEWRGKRRVDDVWEELDRKSRSDIQRVTGPVSQRVRAAVEAPTKMTRGIESDELRRTGMQQARQAGLRGKEARVYGSLYEIAATKGDRLAAREEWLKANMLHNNKLSNFLRSMGRKLDESGGGWGSFIRNLTVPFTSFIGGNIQRAFTDRNVLYNVVHAGVNLKRGNLQGFVDDLGNMATNTTGGLAGAMLLAQTGVLTEVDANGNNYDGLYIKIGDRHIPVAAAGQFAPMLIGGYALNKGISDGDNPAEMTAATLWNTLGGVAKSTDAASLLSGHNSLMQRIGELREFEVGSEDAGERGIESLTEVLGDAITQYIPSLGGDVNAFLDASPLNPTGEAPETKVTKENPETGRQKTDVVASELRRAASRIPGVAQTLPRREGVAGRDPIDRLLKSSRQSDARKAEVAEEQSVADRKAQNEEQGIPNFDERGFDEKVQALRENGDYDKTITALQQEYDSKKDDPEIAKSTKKDLQDEIKRVQVERDGDFDPGLREYYKELNVTDWRKMGDPDSDEYDPDRYQLIWDYDQALAAEKVAAGDFGEAKFTIKKSRSGGRGGRGGSRQGKGPGTPVDIGDISFGQLRGRSTNVQKIPRLRKLRTDELPKRRKITVSRPGR